MLRLQPPDEFVPSKTSGVTDAPIGESADRPAAVDQAPTADGFHEGDGVLSFRGGSLGLCDMRGGGTGMWSEAKVLARF